MASYDDAEFEFDGYPEHPLKFSGETKRHGSVLKFAVDSADECWVDDAAGGWLYKVTLEELVAKISHDKRVLRLLRKAMVAIPEWAGLALAAGWTPPLNWASRRSVRTAISTK